MTRRRRIQFPGAVYHVMARGNRKSMIVDDDDDRRSFMDTFSEAAADYQVRVYACCLMGTHYHALLDTPRGNLSDFVPRSTANTRSRSIAGTPALATRSSSGSHRCGFSVKIPAAGGAVHRPEPGEGVPVP